MIYQIQRITAFILVVFLFSLPFSELHAQQPTPTPAPADYFPPEPNKAFKATIKRNNQQHPNLVAQQTKLIAPDRENGDLFGNAVALSKDGTTAIIGATSDDTSINTDGGSAYVFVRSGSDWIFQAKLVSVDITAGDLFGEGVALSSDGSTAFIGAWGKTYGSFDNYGSAYIFVRSGNIWTQQARFDAGQPITGRQFGHFVALSDDGNTAVTINGPKAFIFVRTQNSWSSPTILTFDDPDWINNGIFRVAISGDGNTLFLSGSGDDTPPTTNNGAVYVFIRNGTTWTQQAKLLASDRVSEDRFGSVLAANRDGNTLLVGTPRKSSPGYTLNGTAYIFKRAGTIWTEQAQLLATDRANYNSFGHHVALNSQGNVALVIADTITRTAYIFTETNSIWTQQVQLVGTDTISDDWFGISVSLNGDGNMALVGAYGVDTIPKRDNGAAYIFEGFLFPPVTPTPSTTPLPPRPDTVAVYKDGVFYLRNTNKTGSADIVATFGGEPSDLPVAGDWNGDGMDTLGIYRVSEGRFYLSDSNVGPISSYVAVLFGNPADTPFAGKWAMDMTGDGIGVYRNSNGILYQRKSLSTGVDDYFAIFGNPGDKGFAGDWNGDAFDSVGVYRPSTQTWYLTNDSTPNGVTYGDVDFIWDIGSQNPVVGDWDSTGNSTIGYLTDTGVFVLHSANAGNASDKIFAFGPANGKPIAGKWTLPNGASRPNIIINGVQTGNLNESIDNKAD